MIRNRISDMRNVNLALKWCKAKERWINHVYDNFINIYVEKQDRYEATRITLGLSSKDRDFNFHSTICWDNLDDYDTKYWKSIEGWIEWFDENIESFQQDIQNGINIVEQYPTISSKLATYLIENLS
ncbi:hypothetical protein [Sharpea azabuensis]|uniref:hypothetical protein n=1 Tax=Sharpea azabuensis TaxID=322505 RepID=UPI001568187C|nr:hypothetical protein [Sharpea azabuensis]